MKYRLEVNYICRGNYETGLADLIHKMKGSPIGVYNQMIKQIISEVKKDKNYDQTDINSITKASLYAQLKKGESNYKNLGLWREENKVLEVDYRKHQITIKNLDTLIKDFQIKNLIILS